MKFPTTLCRSLLRSLTRIRGIHPFELDDWQVVTVFIGSGRMKAQCSHQWHRGLDTKISKYHWPADEDKRRVLELLPKLWTWITAQLANRPEPSAGSSNSRLRTNSVWCSTSQATQFQSRIQTGSGYGSADRE
jgi:hypothetical protein